jgi:RNA polymerase sigma-70 factor (ECF subfamily)
VTFSPKNAAHTGPASVGEDEARGPQKAAGETWSPQELERVRMRDPQALGRFFDAVFPRIYGLLFRLLGNQAEAEDATQEVFVKVHRAIDRLDPERDPSPWLTTIAYNVCRDRWRSAGEKMNRQSVSMDEQPALAGQLRQAGPTPEDDLMASERERLVQRAIDRLPPPQREVVVLHDYEGLSHEEVAGILGASHVAVRKRYSRALAQLAALLKDDLR